MYFSSKRYIEQDLEQHYQLKANVEKILEGVSDYQNCILLPKRHGDRTYYSYRHTGEKKLHYLGNDRKKTVMLIREARFYETLHKCVQNNIDLMEDFLAKYHGIEDDDIRALLPKHYISPSLTPVYAISDEAAEWFRQKNAHKSSIPTRNPEKLVVTTTDGTPVRSRIEGLIYELLKLYGVIYIYELPLEHNGDLIYPDFTILDIRTMMEYIWEHLGMWFTKDGPKRVRYRQDFEFKSDIYQQCGFLPEQNLFLSFEGPNGEIDMSVIERKINAVFGRPATLLDFRESLNRTR